jgi:hypothetical protein
MFLSRQCVCPIGIATARARLTGLADSGWLATACAAAYQDSLDQLLGAWPPERTPARSSLTKSHFLDPIHRPSSTTMGMRWEATGIASQPFPALDANITLTPDGSQHTQITLTGVYRSPLEPPGAGLDRALLHQAATAAIGSLLTRLTNALEDAAAPGKPATPQSPQTGPWTA